YATSPTHDNNCANDAICADGSGTTLDGDLFAVSPAAFPPPSPTTSGGRIYTAGGSSSSGSGFLQSWWLTVQGNNGSYAGTGPVGGGGACSFPTQPGITNPNQYVPSCTYTGSQTNSFNIQNLGMDE